MRKLIVLGLLAGLAGLAALTALPAGGKAPGPNGRIAFARFDAALDGLVTYTANPDGSHVQRLFTGGHSEAPHWSPDGVQVAVLAACTDGEENCAFTIVDSDTGAFRQVKMLDPTLLTACIVWSPDSQRLAYEGLGEPDPSRNGIYTVRSSDGSGLTRMTSNPGGEDLPGDYSPQGERLVFARFDQNEDPVGLYVVKTDGSQLRPITPPGTLISLSSPGDWSPQGNEILFARRTARTCATRSGSCTPTAAGCTRSGSKGNRPVAALLPTRPPGVAFTLAGRRTARRSSSAASRPPQTAGPRTTARPRTSTP
jgi:dipeptidyl aminopeptidase/acylaminoacyl peptidase